MKYLTTLLLLLTLYLTASVFADTGSGESTNGTLTSNPPAQPTLATPGDGTTDVSTSPTVSWQALDHAASYALQVDTDNGFASPLVDENGITATTYDLSGLNGSTTYYWQVCATNVAGDGSFCSPWDFVTEDAPLPVEIALFSAEQTVDGVLIEWTVESELNNMGFVLERTMQNDQTWETIASYETHPDLAGQGTSSQRKSYSFVDVTADYGQTYKYRLSNQNINGATHRYDVISVSLTQQPAYTTLSPAYPNPFNPGTKLTYKLAKAGEVNIAVYDMLGRRVATIVDEAQAPGQYNIYWHGKDDLGQRAATGTFMVVMQTGETVKTQKVVMVK